MAEAIHSFSELATEVKKAIDREDVAVLENIEDNVELTSTAVRAHALNTYLILNKKRYKVIQPISIGDTLTVGTNIQLAPDITAELGSLEETLTNEITTRATLGAHNLLRNLAVSQVINGVTFTVNSDGTVTVSTGSGGATADTNFYLNPSTQTWVNPDYPYGNYILSGCPSGGSAGTYRLALSRQGATSVFDSGSGASFTHSSGVTSLAIIQVFSGAVITTPITFKPMIRLASDSDSTYVPYAISNRQITDTNKLVEYDITGGYVAKLSFTNATRKFLVNKFTRHCMIKMEGIEVTGTIASGDTVTLGVIISTNYIPPYTALGNGIVTDGTNYLNASFSKNSTNEHIAFTARENITTGSTISCYIEWSY